MIKQNQISVDYYVFLKDFCFLFTGIHGQGGFGGGGGGCTTGGILKEIYLHCCTGRNLFYLFCINQFTSLKI